MERLQLQLPPRPLLPPTCAGACAGCASCVLVLQLAWCSALVDWDITPCVLSIIVAGLCVFGASYVVVGDNARRCLAWAGVAIVLTTLSGWRYVQTLQAQRSELVCLPASSCSFVVNDDPTQTDSGFIEHADVYLDKRRVASVVLSSSQCIERGKRFEAVGRWGKFTDSDWTKGNYLQGYVATLQVIKATHVEDAPRGLIDAFRSLALNAIAPDENPANALTAALLCGRTTELKPLGVKDAFSRVGLSHLTAVSGTHLAMVCAVVTAVFDRRGWYGIARNVGTISVLGTYVVFTGLSVSAIRAFIMVFLTLVVSQTDRRGHALSSLMLTVMAMILLDPGVVLELGFQLSALSVLFILLFCSYVETYLKRAHLPDVCAQALSCSLVAQAATLPLTISVFGYVSLVAPLANLIAGPVVSIFLPVGLLTLPLMVVAPWLPLGAALLRFFSSALWYVTQLFAGLPWAAVPLQIDALWCYVFYFIPIAIYAFWPDIKGKTFVLGSLVICGLFTGHYIRWDRFAPPSVTVLDVGQEIGRAHV